MMSAFLTSGDVLMLAGFVGVSGTFLVLAVALSRSRE
jgi:hypothetical protein